MFSGRHPVSVGPHLSTVFARSDSTPADQHFVVLSPICLLALSAHCLPILLSTPVRLSILLLFHLCLQGVIPLALDQIFDRIRSDSTPADQYLVVLSYLEVYNDRVIDLLGSSREPLAVKEDTEQVSTGDKDREVDRECMRVRVQTSREGVNDFVMKRNGG